MNPTVQEGQGAQLRVCFLAIVIVLVTVLGLPFVVSAYGETISISPSRGAPGTLVTVHGTGFGPSYAVPIGTDLAQTPLASGQADAKGTFTQTLRIPTNATPGTLRIWAIIGNGGSADAWFTVTAPPQSVPAPQPRQSLTPQPAVTAPTQVDNANLATQSPYPTVHPGQKVHISITAQNTGTTTWSAASGYGYIGMAGWSSWGFRLINHDVAPQETFTLEDTVTAPQSTGTYNYGFILKHNGANIGPYFFVTVTVVPLSQQVLPAPQDAVLPPILPATITVPVPFQTQLGSADAPGNGAMNCGPASLAMAIEKFRGSGKLSVRDAALFIRHGHNSAASNGGTDFIQKEYGDLLTSFHLLASNVASIEDMERELAAQHPVIVLLNSYQYRYNDPQPYLDNRTNWFSTDHFVVVIGYDADKVFVNDPLRYEGDYRIPRDVFMKAVLSTSTYPHTWHAEAIHP